MKRFSDWNNESRSGPNIFWDIREGILFFFFGFLPSVTQEQEHIQIGFWISRSSLLTDAGNIPTDPPRLDIRLSDQTAFLLFSRQFYCSSTYSTRIPGSTSQARASTTLLAKAKELKNGNCEGYPY